MLSLLAPGIIVLETDLELEQFTVEILEQLNRSG